MKNLLTIGILLTIIFLSIYLINAVEGFQISSEEVKTFLSNEFRISPRRLVDVNHNIVEDKIELSFGLLEKNEAEHSEKTVEELNNLISEKIKTGNLKINVNGVDFPIKNVDSSKKTTHVEKKTYNPSKDDEYLPPVFSEHIDYINDQNMGVASNHNLERYFQVDYKTNTLIKPKPEIEEVKSEIYEENLSS